MNKAVSIWEALQLKIEANRFLPIIERSNALINLLEYHTRTPTTQLFSTRGKRNNYLFSAHAHASKPIPYEYSMRGGIN